MAFESTSYRNIYQIDRASRVSRTLLVILLVLLLSLFLPWTQNIRTKGYVTTLRQEQRAQNLNSVLPGRIVRWYVREGDMVKAGDTLVQLTEVKDDYLDPELLQRTGEMLNAKEQSIQYYQAKSEAQQSQIAALESALSIKIEQLDNKLRQLGFKLKSDSAALSAVRNDFSIADKQYKRQQELYEQGLVSLTQLEQRNQSWQSLQARLVASENNLANTRQEVSITKLELLGARQDYTEKISKARGEMMQALSQVAGGRGDVSKLKNQYATYSNRSKLYFVTAPQDGQIVQARRAGLGEVIKDGETLAQIVPKDQDYAVEIYVAPLDVPLLSMGQKIRFIFDGFPAIVFSGWPMASYGTFGGKVAAIESNVSPNGMYRVLVREDKDDKPWPPQLRLGAGAQAIALLKDVPIWYELWRNINGFPPDYYQEKNGKAEASGTK